MALLVGMREVTCTLLSHVLGEQYIYVRAEVVGTVYSWRKLIVQTTIRRNALSDNRKT